VQFASADMSPSFYKKRPQAMKPAADEEEYERL